MQIPQLPCMVVTFAIFLRTTAAGTWMIDESCDAASGKYDFILQSMTNALAMNAAAFNAISQQPIQNEYQVVLDFLFANRALVTQYGPQVFDSVVGIGRLSQQVSDNTLLTVDSVKIYCDQTRLVRKVNTEGSFWFDNDVNQKLSEVDYSSCSLTGLAFAYTVLPLQNKAFMQVQVCPIFLTWALPTVGNFWTVALSPQYWVKLSVGLMKQIAQRTIYTTIDGVSLFDKVMVHELTHANRNYPTVDVCYGWPCCTSLSTVVTVPGPGVIYGDPDGPELNADSWALFASIAWQLSSNRLSAMNRDGSFT